MSGVLLFRGPRLRDTFLEAARTTTEGAALALNWKTLLDTVPQGDGTPTMIIPGFLAGDHLYTPLRNFLTSIGYPAYKSGININLGPSPKRICKLEEQLDRIADKHGQKVNLIGHSLGGVYAREGARERPEFANKVLTLGTPLDPNTALPQLKTLFQALSMVSSNDNFLDNHELIERLRIPPAVPTSSVYTRRDGIVECSGSFNPAAQNGDKHENIEIYASHVGLAINPLAYLVIADRLAQANDHWQPFDNTKYPGVPFPTVQAHEGNEPPHPGNVPGLHKKFFFK